MTCDVSIAADGVNVDSGLPDSRGLAGISSQNASLYKTKNTFFILFSDLL